MDKQPDKFCIVAEELAECLMIAMRPYGVYDKAVALDIAAPDYVIEWGERTNRALAAWEQINKYDSPPITSAALIAMLNDPHIAAAVKDGGSGRMA